MTKTELSLSFTNQRETVTIEAYGRGIRVRFTALGAMPEEKWALDDISTDASKVRVHISDELNKPSYLENGNIRCEIREERLAFYSEDKLLFEEMYFPWALKMRSRGYKPVLGGDSFDCTYRIAAYDGEIIHGMGQYRDAKYDLKGCTLELAHKNSQISVPFFISSRGYGFLWNNPGKGTATFGMNKTEWHMPSTKKIDYWVCADADPVKIIEKYTEVTGRSTEPLPESLMGLWQCKLRYRTQDELMEVAREYRRRGIKLDVIVIDFFHWNYQGDWSFDPEYWPDPQAMVDELNEMGTRLMVSVWPMVDARSVNYPAFSSGGYLIKTDRGLPIL